jgi:hypothetical protein
MPNTATKALHGRKTAIAVAAARGACACNSKR